MKNNTVQKIFQQHGPNFIKRNQLPLRYLKAINKLVDCRTDNLGGHAQYCENNHLNGIWYNSCKHRFCPQCRGMATEEWLLNTKKVLLDCAHHHIVFTFPSELNDIWRFNQAIVTDILFKATQQTLQMFSKDPKYLGAIPGMLSVLHTWGRNLVLHPHIHVLLSHGGIDKHGEWVEPKKTALFPQKPVMMVFRGKLLSLLKGAMKIEAWKFPPDTQESQFSNLLNKLGRKEWVVHFCKRYDYAEGVAKYLSRYVKSGPLKNQQIVTVTDEEVTYRYKSHQTKKTEMLTLTIDQFIHRLIQHTPLPGKPTVRYCGLYNSGARKKLNIARNQKGQKEVGERIQLRWQEFLEQKDDMPICKVCGLLLTRMVEIKPLRKVA